MDTGIPEVGFPADTGDGLERIPRTIFSIVAWTMHCFAVGPSDDSGVDCVETETVRRIGC